MNCEDQLGIQKLTIARLTKERDEARRELCQADAIYHGENDVDIAKERGWDCFENCTKVKGEWLVNDKEEEEK